MSKNKHIDKLVDSYIQQEKQLEPNPFLASKIVNQISNNNATYTTKNQWLIKLVGVSGIAAMLAIGILIGSTYTPASQLALNINDIELEQLSTYNILMDGE